MMLHLLHEAVFIGWLVGLHIFSFMLLGGMVDGTLGRWTGRVGLHGWLLVALFTSPLTPYVLWVR